MKKILLIDSDLRILSSLANELREHFAVLNCEKGEKALNLCKVFSPDAVILDPTMPGLGPENIIPKIRAIPSKANILIVVTSYSSSIRKMEEHFEWGADFYFQKPVNPGRIRLKLERAFRNFEDGSLQRETLST